MYRVVLTLSLICMSMVYLVHTNRAVFAREELVTKLPAKLLLRHQQYPGCLKLDEPTMPPEGTAFSARLDKNTQVYGILCEPSAYNWAYAIYVVRDGRFEEAERQFFADFDISSGWVGTDVLFNASMDEKTGTLRGFSKARGLGDCGSLTTLKWEDERFNLMEFRYKDKCDEDIERPFPLIYKRHLGK